MYRATRFSVMAGASTADQARPCTWGANPDVPAIGPVLARAEGENFQVASRLLGRRYRSSLVAFYGYARLVDELGDTYEGNRLQALDWLEGQVRIAWRGDPGEVNPLVGSAVRAARAAGAGTGPLLDLIEANRRDQHTTRYETFDELMEYCRHSANPVGRLVLAAFGAATPERLGWSDSICSALQVAEHLQDVAEDAREGRVYLPMADMQRFSTGADELLRTVDSGRRLGTNLRAVIAFNSTRAWKMLEEGEPLVASLRGRARLAVAGYVAGGRAALESLSKSGFDPISRPTSVDKSARARICLGILLGSKRIGRKG